MFVERKEDAQIYGSADAPSASSPWLGVVTVINMNTMLNVDIQIRLFFFSRQSYSIRFMDLPNVLTISRNTRALLSLGIVHMAECGTLSQPIMIQHLKSNFDQVCPHSP